MRQYAHVTGILLLASAIIGFAGCTKSSEPTGQPPTTQPAAPGTEPMTAGPWTIGMSQCNLGEPWRVQMNADVKAAALRHNEKAQAEIAKLTDDQGRPYTQDIEVIFKDAQNDTQKQRAHVEEFVSQGVDLIIVSPKEAEPLTAPVAEADQQVGRVEAFGGEAESREAEL